MTGVLERLIAPLSFREFFADYWGVNFHISEGPEDRFSSLYSWEALSEMLSTQRFDFPRLRLLRNGEVVPPEQYIVRKTDRRGNRYVTHSSQAVRDLLDTGAMLHITSIGEAWEPLMTFAAAFERQIGAKVQVNLHAGYRGSPAFRTHWDGHDVYAVQIDGEKEWRLFGITADSPLPVPPSEKHGAPTDHTWEGSLQTGQVLYMPRGYWHATRSLSAPSLHLTFAVQHPTSLDFLHWAFGRWANDLTFRKDIPAGVFESIEGSGVRKAQYLMAIRGRLSETITHALLEEFLAEYRATLGLHNGVTLTPMKGEYDVRD